MERSVKDGKRILQEKALQEKAREQAEKLAEIEKEKRKKKLRERMRAVFLSYAKAAREEELRLTREEAQRLKSDFQMQMALEARKKTERILYGLKHHDEFIDNFFNDFEKTEPEEKRKAREELLNDIGMEKKDYHTIAMSAALQNEEHRESASDILCGKPCESREEADSMRREALDSTDRILGAFREGNTEELRNLLTANLELSCREFATAPDPVVALHWARHIGNIVSVFEHNKKLTLEEKDAKLFETAVGITAMGRVMESGYAAMLKMQDDLISGRTPKEEEAALLQAEIVLMQQIDEKRNSSAYQKYFAQSERSETQSPEENMKRVLQQLSQSSILQQISSMTPEEKCFAFSDHESRKYLTNEIFNEEKKPAQAEAVQNTAEIPAGRKGPSM